MTFVQPNRTGKGTTNDVVMTPESLAIKILDYFKPTGIVLEPCRGTGNFYRNIKGKKDWCEITEGKDFLEYQKKVDWIITNPPFSIYDLFLLHSFEIVDNIVFLTVASKAFKSQKIDNAIQEFGGLKEIVLLGGGGKAGFPFGFLLCCLYYKRNFRGKIKLTRRY